MSFSPRDRERGSAVFSLFTMLSVGGLALLFLRYHDQHLKVTHAKVKNTRFSVQMASGVETMLAMYRLAEISYNSAMNNCPSGTGRAFLRALKEGHGCTDAGMGTINVFGNADAAGITDVSNSFSYMIPSGCRIDRDTPLTCGTTQLPVKLATIGIQRTGVTAAQAARQKLDGASFEFVLNAVIPANQIVEFVADVTPAKYTGDAASNPGTKFRRGFAIRGSLPFTAHIEADGRVTQDAPDPISRCPIEPWQTARIYNPGNRTCESFVQLGGGTGLAFYQGRYFGFRPADGQVIDMLTASQASASSYLVEENGTVGGVPVFPQYRKDMLRNADDITTVGSQIYYVGGQVREGHIGTLTFSNLANPVPPLSPAPPPGTPLLIPICRIGRLNWGQSFVGLASLDWGEQIIPSDAADAAVPRTRLATFFLKSATGDLLTAVVRSAEGPLPASPSCAAFTAFSRTYWSCCTVFKDADLQQIEYHRTWGFDRTSAIKPYFLY
jgi:hypothetical protein